MSIAFTKMHGLGNDFIVIEALGDGFTLSAEQIRKLADRHFGIGFDQLLVVEPPTSDEMDLSYRIFNADGIEVEQCGNGARCFARFVYDRGLTKKTEIRVGTRSGIILTRLLENGLVCVDMGRPEFEPDNIPFTAGGRQRSYALSLDEEEVNIAVISMGNPHAVQVVEDIETARVRELGPKIEAHPRFSLRVNAGFMQLLDRGSIKLRVWERGSGETLACGSGACAAVVAGIEMGLLDTTVKVFLRGGSLEIEWAGGDAPVLMTGPAVYVYDGMFELENL